MMPSKVPIKMSDEASSRRRAAARVRRVRGRFDSAVTNDDNRRHWANADAYSADVAASVDVRRTLRNRARYEVANNSYARGIVCTLANDTIGTGPRLQLLTDDSDLNRQVEHDFERWAMAVRLAEKLRTTRMARCQDGEGFGILANNPNLDHPIKLDLLLVEADRVTSTFSTMPTDNEVDGIKLDEFGNPTEYRVLKHHPGGNRWGGTDDADYIPARNVIHMFRADRPGQHRGLTELMPALGLFAQLRRYTLAVIAAAETAADYAAVLYTDAPADGEAEPADPFDTVELESRMATTIPMGWKLAQIKAEQPATTYAEFKKEILNEIARCISIPFNVAAGNSSGYNYASGRLDHQTYFKSIRVDQAFTAERALDPILAQWLWEWQLLHGVMLAMTQHQWFWDGTEHVDPQKEAKAQETRLKNHTTTLANEYARQGKDWEAEIQQRAREKKLLQSLGLTEGETASHPSKKAAAIARTNHKLARQLIADLQDTLKDEEDDDATQ